jgi:hypothetical protein
MIPARGHRGAVVYHGRRDSSGTCRPSGARSRPRVLSGVRRPGRPRNGLATPRTPPVAPATAWSEHGRCEQGEHAHYYPTISGEPIPVTSLPRPQRGGGGWTTAIPTSSPSCATDRRISQSVSQPPTAHRPTPPTTTTTHPPAIRPAGVSDSRRDQLPKYRRR